MPFYFRDELSSCLRARRRQPALRSRSSPALRSRRPMAFPSTCLPCRAARARGSTGSAHPGELKRYSNGMRPSRSATPSVAGPAAEDRRASGIRLHFSFEADEQRGAALGNPLFELLAAVLETGSIRHAALALGTSYRYVWGSLHKWERELGEPLIVWAQGQRARPTQFAERLLWAERRARTRMQPHIEALRSG